MPGLKSSSASPTRISPSVDVLVPHYNDIAGLSATLDSIDAQDWSGQPRIVVADDGSRAEVRAEVAALLDARERPVVFIQNETNRGRPYTRNVLLDAAESEYLTWLDAGDDWYPAKMSAQLAKAAELAAGKHGDEPHWITCHYDWKWAGGKPRKIRQRTDVDQLKALLRGRALRAYLWTLLGPTSTFKNVGWFDEKLTRLQDLDFFLRFILKGGQLSVPEGDESLCVYHKSDVGRDADEIRACNAYIFDKYRVLYNRYGPSFCREQLFHMEMLSARFAANNNDSAKKRHYMMRAFTRAPKRFGRHLRIKGLRP